MTNTKYIFVIGGVMSSVGKGVASASIGKILQACGYEVTIMKIDPYINVDAGTMNPTEHGEVFVTEDGDETDQDIGNYERFIEKNILSTNYMTTGRVYREVIQRERNLEYDGKCVEVVPHIPMEVIDRIKTAGKKTKSDIVIIEIGGTIGEYQNVLFLEAGRMLKLKYPQDVLFVLVSYLPIPAMVGEMKTKPTQHAVRTLNSAGLQPDFIICRSERAIDKKRREKLAVFCGINPKSAISCPDVDSVYEVPLMFKKEKLDEQILDKFDLKARKTDLKKWKNLVQKSKRLKKKIRIAVVGKYFGTGDFTLSDSYISVIEAVKHASWQQGLQPEMEWVDSEDYEKDPKRVKELGQYDGVIVPGGFGTRGIEGIIKAIKYVRENNIPYLGLCYGMQLATIEFARSVAKIKNATSTELDPNAQNQVIHIMPDQEKKLLKQDYGGTMRLGAWPCKLRRGTHAQKAYGKSEISERHRHRYEFNNAYRSRLEKAGLKIAGTSPDNHIVEIIELEDHPFFIGVQFHPEFKSRPLDPHPLYLAFVKACMKKK
ncbi:MAG: CTP synthase [Parcubacteria group bacterium CG_4_9_14_0_2_um_filter_41_8]|nr:MAG: CTP synthase [Parcubacteria group bacterium CG_4_9_14_0_2_um_filter_41_8]